LDKPYDTNRKLNFLDIKRHFHGVVETRDIMDPAMSIWGFLFLQTRPQHKAELQEILHSTLEEYMI
jgi:hypothetical protein